MDTKLICFSEQNLTLTKVRFCFCLSSMRTVAPYGGNTSLKTPRVLSRMAMVVSCAEKTNIFSVRFPDVFSCIFSVISFTSGPGKTNTSAGRQAVLP